MPTQSDRDLSRREEMSVSGAAMSAAPWAAATVTGGVVAAGDLALHLIGHGLGLGALSGSAGYGGGGVLRGGRSRCPLASPADPGYPLG